MSNANVGESPSTLQGNSAPPKPKLLMALRGLYCHPADPHPEFTCAMPRSAVDLALLRVQAEEYRDDSVNMLRDLRGDAESSVELAKLCSELGSALESREAHPEDIAATVTDIVIRCMRGAFILGCEAHELQFLDGIARHAGNYPQDAAAIAKLLFVTPEQLLGGAR